MNIELAGHRVTLLPERAMYLHDTQTLLIADAHLGKAAAFRKLGVPVPAGTTAQNLQLISDLMARTQAREIIFLGDLFHNEVALDAKASSVMQQWCAWRERHADISIVLLIGNHDAKALKKHPLPEACGIALSATFEERGNLRFQHDLPPVHEELRDKYLVTGHIHPGVYITGKARQAHRLPCFCFGQSAGVLPAFGAFTGLHLITPEAGDEVYVIVENRVVQKPA